MSSQNEQRKFIRMNLESNILYRLPDSQRFFSGRCKNLSPTGLMFNCYHQLETGQMLEVHIVSEDSVTPTMRILVKVALVKQSDTASFNIGTEIVGTMLS
jgi:hypothetical protein